MKSPWFKVAIPFLVILALLCLCVLFLPAIASTSWGKGILVNAIEKKLGGDLSIHSLKFTWLGPQKIQGFQFESKDADVSFDSLTCDLKLWSLFSLSNFHLRGLLSLDGMFELKNANADLHMKNLPRAMIEHLDAKIHTRKGMNSFADIDIDANVRSREMANVGLFNIYGKIGDLFNARGKLDLENISCNLRARIENFPAYIWDFFLKNPLFTSFLGENASIESEIILSKGSGSVDVDVSSSNLKTSLDGRLDEGVLRLNRPLNATFSLNQKIGKTLLKDTNPVFLTAVRSLEPAVLKIDSQGFQLPLSPFDKKKIMISSAQLDMKKIECENGGTLAMLVSLLKLGSLQGTQEMEVWFTPLDFSLRNGTLKTERTDMLVANAVHVMTWGDINIVNEKLRMTLGISGSALKRAFGIDLSDDYVLQIPIRGTTDNPKIDLSKAGALIAALVAGNIAPGPFGKILGGAASAAGEKPPPQRYPLPWGRITFPSRTPFDTLWQARPNPNRPRP